MYRVSRNRFGVRCWRWNLVVLSILTAGIHANSANAQSIFDDWINGDGTVDGFVEDLQQEFANEFADEYQQAFEAPAWIDEPGILDPDDVFGAIGDAFLDEFIEPPFTDFPSFLDWADENPEDAAVIGAIGGIGIGVGISMGLVDLPSDVDLPDIPLPDWGEFGGLIWDPAIDGNWDFGPDPFDFDDDIFTIDIGVGGSGPFGDSGTIDIDFGLHFEFDVNGNLVSGPDEPVIGVNVNINW